MNEIGTLFVTSYQTFIYYLIIYKTIMSKRVQNYTIIKFFVVTLCNLWIINGLYIVIYGRLWFCNFVFAHFDKANQWRHVNHNMKP